jgi:glycosyltransferase involved in cell wall biosynthesis
MIDGGWDLRNIEVEGREIAVCVLITSFNYGEYLREAVQSVATQKYRQREWQNIEMIIVDDGSEDDSREVIESLKDEFEKRFIGGGPQSIHLPKRETQTLEERKKRGKLDALNRGLRVVKSPITIILDADDRLDPAFTEKTVSLLVEEHNKDHEVAFVYTDCMYFGEGEYGASGPTHVPVGEFNAQAVLRGCNYIPETAPTLTAVLKSVIPFDTSIKVQTKLHKWQRIVEHWNGAYLPEPLLEYRQHARNMSGSGERYRKHGPPKRTQDYWEQGRKT